MLALIFFTFINFAMASSLCHVYEFQGLPVIDEDRILLKIHEKSNSEIIIHIRPSDVTNLAPYIGLSMKGEVTIDTQMGPREFGAKSFVKLDHGTPDPLNEALNSYMKRVREEKCQ